ncbi:MAG: hypothetical protein H7841_07170 [Magnetospirillum sp. WYHS-4]
MRPSSLAFALIGAGSAFVLASAVDARLGVARAEPALARKAEMVRELGLTDLCLFTEARYTRHLSQADLHTAFQDHPLSLDHFPSGSLVPPRRTF